MFVIYEFSLQPRVLVPCKPFKPSPMFASKAVAYMSDAPRVVSSPYPHILDQAGKAR